MGYSIFLLEHLDGELVAPDAELLHRVVAPYVPAGRLRRPLILAL
ncbi:hypothetical protein ACIA8O_02635 [Kitasatospora sp. NPDC051853]